MKKIIAWTVAALILLCASLGLAAGVKIGDATHDDAVGGGEKLPVDDAGTGKYMTVDELLARALAAYAWMGSINGLTEADVSVLETTADNTYNVVTSGGNNYILGSNSDNTALEFKTPANVLTQIGGQASSATLISLAGLTETNGGIAYGTADNAYAWLAAGTANYLLQGNGAGAPSWTNAPTVSGANITGIPLDSDFTAADEIMVGTGAGTHGQVTLGASEILGKAAAGNVTNLSAANVRTIINVADGADVTSANDPKAHTSSHAVSGADTVFPADPGADRYLMWDDVPGELVWSEGSGGGSGDITKVGDCESGDCLDGSSDGGTYIAMYDGDSNYTKVQAGNSSADLTFTLPTAYAAASDYLLKSSDAGVLGYADPATFQAASAALASIAGLSEADVSVLECTADNAYAVVTSGGNNYILGSNSDNTALEFKTPANVLSQIGAQATHAYLTDIAGITANQGDIIYFDGTDWVDLAPGDSGKYLKTQGAGANPAWDTPAGGAPTDATYIVQTADGDLSAEQALGALATGILKNETTTGVLSIASAGTDYVAPDADITSVAGGVTGIVKGAGDGNGYSAATAGTDYSMPYNVRVECTTDTVLTEIQCWNTHVTNQGAAGEVDIQLYATSQGCSGTFICEEAQNIEVNPPAGEIPYLNGTPLDADDCIDSDSVEGSILKWFRHKDSSGDWHYYFYTVSGVWSDTGASD